MSTKILCWNVNGIRAIVRKGFLEWLKKESPDILCVQETKASPESLDKALLEPEGYHVYWNYPERKGYSGVATFTKVKPLRIKNGLWCTGVRMRKAGCLFPFTRSSLFVMFISRMGNRALKD